MKKARESAPIQLTERRQLELEELLENFRTKCENTGGVVEYAFPDSMTNEERRFVHLKAQLMGFITKSVGKEPHRYVTIKKRTGNSEASETIILSRDSLGLIKNLTKKNLRNVSSQSKPPVMQNSGKKTYGTWMTKVPPPLRAYQQHRQELPIWSTREQILKTVRECRAVLIRGGTGCGKSTQVPQYLLEEAAQRQEAINIICTLPRRVAVISICDRVASERDEQVGRTVGYKIRLESVSSADTVLTFCTPGVLLRSLSDPSFLTGVTHLILDEVHERDKFSDFLLGYLKHERNSLQRLRVIMMSADVDVQIFSDFFESCRLINVEGTMFPVQELYLNDVLKLVEFKDESTIRSLKKERPPTQISAKVSSDVHQLLLDVISEEDEFAASKLVKLVKSGKIDVDFLDPELNVTILGAVASRFMVRHVGELMQLGADLDKESNGWKARDLIGMLEASWVEQFETTQALENEDALVNSYIKTINIDRIDAALIFKLIRHIHMTKPDTYAILVFLPGFEDIITLKYLISHKDFGNPNTYRLFLLHSTIEADQRNVFKSVPRDVRKIILSTNIAETSLTIDGVAYVVDTGKVKEKSYDSQTHCSMLRSTWISKASANQRRGRAGRQCPGICYRLYTEKRFSTMDDFQLSEIVRSSLQELCLHCKAFLPRGIGISQFFYNVPDPPPEISINDSVKALKVMNALTQDEELTELGRILTQFPMEPALAKTLVYSAIFKCLNPVLDIVATLCYRSPFLTVGGNEEKTAAQNAKKELSAGSYSDHIAISQAVEGWASQLGQSSQRRFCDKYFLSHSSLLVINGVVRQLLDIMSSTCLKMYKNTDWGFFNTNSRNWSVVRAILAIGLYPNLCKVTESKAYLFNKIDQKIRFHFLSTLSNGNLTVLSLPSDWVVYGEMGRNSTSCSVQDCSVISPITVALMAGLDSAVQVDILIGADESSRILKVGEWIAFRGDAEIIKGIYDLRNQWKFVCRDFFATGKFHEVHGEILNSTLKILNAEDIKRNAGPSHPRQHGPASNSQADEISWKIASSRRNTKPGRAHRS